MKISQKLIDFRQALRNLSILMPFLIPFSRDIEDGLFKNGITNYYPKVLENYSLDIVEKI